MSKSIQQSFANQLMQQFMGRVGGTLIGAIGIKPPSGLCRCEPDTIGLGQVPKKQFGAGYHNCRKILSITLMIIRCLRQMCQTRSCKTGISARVRLR